MAQAYDAADWSKHDDDFTQIFYSQNTKQFWLPEEISLNGDLLTWKFLSYEEKDTYKKVLAGLTLLDTEQGDIGMPLIAAQVKGHQRKAVLNFMAMMENAVHAKSYSNIFLTLASTEEINEVFEWVKENKYLHKVIDRFKDTLGKFIKWVCKKFDLGAEDAVIRDFEKETHALIDVEKEIKHEKKEKAMQL